MYSLRCSQPLASRTSTKLFDLRAMNQILNIYICIQKYYLAVSPIHCLCHDLMLIAANYLMGIEMYVICKAQTKCSAMAKLRRQFWGPAFFQRWPLHACMHFFGSGIILVLLPPICRDFKCSLPYALLCVPSLSFIRDVCFGVLPAVVRDITWLDQPEHHPEA